MISRFLSSSGRSSGFTSRSSLRPFHQDEIYSQIRRLLPSGDPLHKPIRSDANFPLITPPTHILAL